LNFIDLFILVPGAIGTFLTALIYSIWTNWGWFKHNWITVKWIICIFGIVYGTFWLGPWLSEMAHIAKDQGMKALSDPEFLCNRQNLMIFGTSILLNQCEEIFYFFIKDLDHANNRP